MSSSTSQPNSDLIYDLYGGGFLSQFIRLALRLDVFSPLAARPRGADQVAKSCGADPRGVRILLNYLSSTGILLYQPETDVYSLTPAAAVFLVRGETTFAGDWVLANTDPDLWEKMLQTLRSGESAGYDLPWAQDAWLESYSPSRVNYSMEMWQTVGVKIPRKETFQILDLASGCGIKTLALAQAYPSVAVTCVDSAEVLVVARDLAERFGVIGQTSFIPGNILSDGFGSQEYHAALLGLITYYLTPEQNYKVFQTVFQALSSGGRLVIDAIMASQKPSEWASRASLLMSTWNGGSAYSFEQYQDWLLAAGFTSVTLHNQQLLSAVK